MLNLSYGYFNFKKYRYISDKILYLFKNYFHLLKTIDLKSFQ